MVFVALAVLGVIGGIAALRSSTYTWSAVTLFWAGMLPTAWRDLRTARQPATVTVEGDRVVIVHPGLLREPISVSRDELHSVAPLWLHPPAPPGASRWRRIDALLMPLGVRPSVHVPVLGTVMRNDHAPALALVFDDAKTFAAARSRWAFPIPVLRRDVDIHGLLIAVDDLEAAQRPFVGWGKLASLTPDALEWLTPGRAPTSWRRPGP